MKKSKICIKFTILVFVNVSFYFNAVNTKDEVYLCKKPFEVSNGNCTPTNNGNNGLSHKCTLTCEKYYQVKPSFSMVCGNTKQWIGASPSCERVLCNKPNPPINGRAKCASTNIANKYSSCILTCENPYKWSNEKDNKDKLTIQCYLDSKGNPSWDSYPSECKLNPKNLCDKPSPPKNGRAKCASTNIANKYFSCILTCENPYKWSNEKDNKDELTIQCHLDSKGNPKWETYPSECKSSPLVKCEPIKDIIKGSVKCAVDKIRFYCKIECDPGYSVRRSEDRSTKNPFCHLNGNGVYVWENYYRECFLTPCEKPNLKWPLDGDCSDNHCDLWCATGYQLEGKNKMDCFNNEWSEKMPICKNPSNFPIQPQPCSENSDAQKFCIKTTYYMNRKREILKRYVVKCYNWMELYKNHPDYIMSQFNLTDTNVKQIIKSKRTMDCALVAHIEEKYDGKRDCKELCPKTFTVNSKNDPIGGYNVGNENVITTCMCVTKHFYNNQPYE